MSEETLICPKCGAKISYDPPYWPKMRKFYCSQRCATA